MYLYLGGSTVVENNSIIGIFDMDQTTVSSRTRNFLSIAQKNGIVRETSFELPKSFVVCEKNGETTVYITQPNTSTFFRRVIYTD